MRKTTCVSVFATLLAISVSGPALAAGDAAAGKKVFDQQCIACHGTTPGAHKMGPSLAGIFGKRAGSTDFKRYVGLKGLDVVWNEETLDKFLADPAGFVGGQTSMFSKMADAQQRADVIEYLKTLK